MPSDSPLGDDMCDRLSCFLLILCCSYVSHIEQGHLPLLFKFNISHMFGVKLCARLSVQTSGIVMIISAEKAREEALLWSRHAASLPVIDATFKFMITISTRWKPLTACTAHNESCSTMVDMSSVDHTWRPLLRSSLESKSSVIALTQA